MGIKLSIIIPHYNIPDMLCELLKTIPDRDDVEVIIIDDCSLVSLERVKVYLKQRTNIKLVFEEKNCGAGKCRNDGLRMATGKWLLFADADDRFCSGFYEIISQYFDGDWDIVFFMATSVEIETGELGTRHELLNETVRAWLNDKSSKKSELNIRYKLNGPVCKMIRMDLIRNHSIEFEQVAVSNDEMFSTRAGFYASKIAADERCIYCITCRPGSLIQVISKENFWIRLQVFIRKFFFLKGNLTNDDFNLLDLSAQEKVFSVLQNRYGIRYCMKVIRELHARGIPFITKETLRPRILVAKIRLAIGLYKERIRNRKYISKE